MTLFYDEFNDVIFLDFVNIMTVNQNIHVEINKLLENINSHTNCIIPYNIKKRGESFYHSRDSAIVICSLIYLVDTGQYSFAKLSHIILKYLHFEKHVYYSRDSSIIPKDRYNYDRMPYITQLPELEQYDVIALRCLAFYNCYRIFKSFRSEELIDDVLFTSGMYMYYIQLITHFYNTPCHDMWGKVHGIHFSNTKLYQMALLGFKNTYYFITSNHNTLKNTIEKTLVDLSSMLTKFEQKVIISNKSYDIFVPKLENEYKVNTLRYTLNSSVMFPYLPIFGYSEESISHPRLLNTALIVFSNNDENMTNIINNRKMAISIPYISRYGFIIKKNNNGCVLSTLATYHVLSIADDDIIGDTILRDWPQSAYRSFKRGIFNTMVKLYPNLKAQMGNNINKLSKIITSTAHENSVRCIYSCVMDRMCIFNGEDNRSIILKEFKNAIKKNVLDGFLDDNGITKTKTVDRDKGKDKTNGTGTNLIIMSIPGLKNNKINDGNMEIRSFLGPIPEKQEDCIKNPNANKYNFQKKSYCRCNSKDKNQDKNQDKMTHDDNNESITVTIETPREVSLQCFIDLANQYYCFKCDRKKKVVLSEELKTVNMENIVRIRDTLLKLTKMRGLKDIKDGLLDNITNFINGGKGEELLHTCITGPPGVGKTVLASVIADLYKALGILSKGHIVKASRPDLIGKYLGHTAAKTADIIKKAEGGILFIDEVYSLVDKEGRDSFSKECVDTLTQYLTDKCHDMICIVAGYKEDVENYFFKSNKGLSRRFAFKYNIEGYKYDELFEIFCDKMSDKNWTMDKLEEESMKELFKDKYELFKNFGGDIENLVFRYGLVFNRENIFSRDKTKKIKLNILKTSIDHLFAGDNETPNWKFIYS